ncbi:extracellular solute-binding protein [Halopseudomonas bauzanensis]|uniref:ABC transporter substrate-binding protein n=1 Tax=Halopseudomonas bauzanensis TaxID=653930 RepID=A0A4U0YEN9_9GAMM|nr:extracellular solute-binding protein [Halopseudomonas bauzanensis]TKA90300.1 ABC transporter substrate-binding protein [Halopseudomonas bauzanensis]
MILPLKLLYALLLITLLCPAASAAVYKQHGYAVFGQPKYTRDFTHLDYVNPDAPKGGTLRVMGSGIFDTLNPYTLKGTSPISTGNFYQYGISELNEPLMVGNGIYDPSGDEPYSAYGLIAETLEFSDDRSWVVFNLRPQARFHDGRPITAHDVAFSYRLLSEQGHPNYRAMLQEIERIDLLGTHRIRFIFKSSNNPLLILRLGELPVLPEHYWRDRDFTATTFEPALNSGPYRITQVMPGRRVVFQRVKDYWGKDLPINRGKYNVDRLEVEFYRDNNVAFEAFKAGEFDIYLDHKASNWANAYDFPAVTSGAVVKRAIKHEIPASTQALFFNTRRSPFDQRLVRQALGMLFDFEWSNRVLFYDAYQRSLSYYPNSPFSATDLPAGQEFLYLSEYRDQLPSELFLQPYSLPTTDGRGIPRDTLRQAVELFAEAGWTLRNGRLQNAAGRPLTFEVLLVNPSLERILLPWSTNLARLGIDLRIRTVDRAQYKARLDQFDFDMILTTLPQTLSPGYEQHVYFHSSQRDVKGSRNYAGIANPIIDELLGTLLAANTRTKQIAAAKAIDRVLLWEHYTIPNWYINYHRIAHRSTLRSLTTPPYSLSIRSWWIDNKTD